MLILRSRGINLVLPNIETKTFSQANGICARDRSAQTFDRRKYLLKEIEFNVRLQARISLEDIL
jgi:hypothetical protein